VPWSQSSGGSILQDSERRAAPFPAKSALESEFMQLTAVSPGSTWWAPGETSCSGCRLQDYLAPRWRKPKPSERVRVAVKLSNSIGVGYAPDPDHAEVW
jgi:hypothetical protein